MTLGTSSWARRAERVGGWLRHPRWPLVTALVGVVLTLPSLPLGHMVDDLMHAHVLRGGDVPGGPRGVWDLYTFADGGAGIRRGIDEGMFPWWSSPTLKFAFLRPLSSILITLDHRVLGAVPWVSHLLSCALYGLLVYLVACLFRRVLPGATGGLAALLFAVDDAHHFPVLWIANRHSILSGALAIAALLAHMRHREGKGPGWIGPLLFAASLGAGESALTVLPYVAAWAWWMDPGGRRAALRALAPWGAVLGAWAVVYVVGGYGTRDSGVYLDPVGQPIAFVIGLVTRLPQLLLAQIFLPPADIAPLIPRERAAAAAAAGLVLLLAVAVPLLRATRGHPAQRVLAVGGLLSLVPCCATFPSDRLLLLSGVGAFGLVAIVLQRAVVAWRDGVLGRASRGFAVLLAAVHLPLAAMLLPLRVVQTGQVFTAGIARGAASLPADPGVRGKTMVVLVTPDTLMTTYMFLQRLVEGAPVPDRSRVLAVSQRGSVTITREGERALLLRGTEALNVDVFSSLYRAHRYVAGERVRAGDLEVEVVEVDGEGWPRALRFTFDAPIGGDTQRWLIWRERSYAEVPVLAPGDSMSVPSTDWMSAMQP